MDRDVEIRSLEHTLAQHKADSRLEASMTFSELICALELAGNLGDQAGKRDDFSVSWLNDRPVNGELFFREGLGLWRVLLLAVENLGTIWIGVPEGETDVGVSLWYASRDLTSGQVATLLTGLTKVSDVMFIDPFSGQAVPKSALPLQRTAT